MLVEPSAGELSIYATASLSGYDTTKLSAEFHADLNWWLSFAEVFNGVGKAIRVSDSDVVVYTDAFGSGFGGYLSHGGDYFWGVWSPPGMSSPCHLEAGPDFDLVSSSINAKELWPVLVAYVVPTFFLLFSCFYLNLFTIV